MDNKQVTVAVGGLLHDIGKLLYRYNDGRNHCISGHELLKSAGIKDEDVLNQVKYHHGALLRNSNVSKDSAAYITYWADNVAAGADRREKLSDIGDKEPYEKDMPLESVFNILNGNKQDYTYDMQEVYDSGDINYPHQNRTPYSEIIYSKIISNIKEGLSAIELTDEYVNSLLGVLEANLSFVPSSTSTKQVADISLYDHVKITAAIGGCILEYLKASGETDFKKELFDNCTETYNKKTFLLLSMDMSGIQEFLFKIDSEDALKTLRSKSFYLEILLEHIVDELLNPLGLSRANLIYSGGGHAYILLPNTSIAKDTITNLFKNIKKWMLDYFGTDLYVAYGYAECSANELMDKPEGSYQEIFARASEAVSLQKTSRYNSEEIILLNTKPKEQLTRECRICGTTEKLNSENLCPVCAALIGLSKKIQDKPFVSIVTQKEGDSCAHLPLGKYMIMESEESLRQRTKNKANFVRAYSKNKMYTGFNLSTRLWVGNYYQGNSFKELANASKGINRIGVLRADVDNLGKAFVRGFSNVQGEANYSSLSRSATFSRKLSMFFKLNINYLLGNAAFSMEGERPYPLRDAAIVYSGGDDLFIIGAWNSIIETAVDINEALKNYTQGTLTISAGIGIYPEKYPVTALARETGKLEDISKLKEGKNAITLFNEENSYHWDEFKNEVIGQKLSALSDFYGNNDEKGNSQIYKLMGYLRNIDEKINLARLAYLLGRIEPPKDASQELKDKFKQFARNIYKWAINPNDRKELITAIYIYVYLNRSKKEEK